MNATSLSTLPSILEHDQISDEIYVIALLTNMQCVKLDLDMYQRNINDVNPVLRKNK